MPGKLSTFLRISANLIKIDWRNNKMKITMGRKMKIVVAVLIVAVLAFVMLSPYSFEKYTASSKLIQVTSTDTVTKDANGKKKQQVYSFKQGDKKYTEINEFIPDGRIK